MSLKLNFLLLFIDNNKMLYDWFEYLYLTFYRIVYSGVRCVAQFYLTMQTDSLQIEREWYDEDKLVQLLKVKLDGHVRSFILTQAITLPYTLEEIDWDQVIHFGNDILACSMGETDVTEEIKRYSHYIMYNPFFTVGDFIQVTKLNTDYLVAVNIIYSDLEEKQITVNRQLPMKEMLGRL